MPGSAGGKSPASVPAPLQATPGSDPVEVRSEALSGATPQFAGNKPVIMAAPRGAAPAGGPHAPEMASGPKTLSTPADNPEMTLVPAQTGLTGDRSRYSDPLYVLMLAVGIILLIACANFPALILAPPPPRQKE